MSGCRGFFYLDIGFLDTRTSRTHSPGDPRLYSHGMRLSLVYILSAISFCSSAQNEVKINGVEIRKTVTAWVDAHSLEKVDKLFDLYDETVFYYGAYLPRARCIGMKRTTLAEDWTFSHQITSPLRTVAFESGTIKCEFDKTITKKGKTKVVPSYLLLREIDGSYLIVGESDPETDTRVGRSVDLGKQLTSDIAEEPATDVRTSTGVLVGISLALAVALGLGYFIVAKPRSEKPKVARTETVTNPYPEKGHDFEAYVVEKFNRPCFKLIRWQGDKSHLGIRPLANSDPDLEYQFSLNGFVRSFALECKYRSGTGYYIQIEERNLNAYNAFSKRTGMPVYIVLGVGGEPRDPAELYLVPLPDVRSKMTLRELRPFRKDVASFYYNTAVERLT